MNEEELLQKFADGSITSEEAKIFREHRRNSTPEELEALEARYQAIWKAQAEYGPVNEALFAVMEQRIQIWESQSPKSSAPANFLNNVWFRYAAIFLIIAGAAIYLFYNVVPLPTPEADLAKTMHIAPGKEGAILTLADGSQMILDSLDDGLVAAQNGADVLLKNGQIVYDATGITTLEMVYNTVSTPKGRQFQVVLPDGTKVWLNAASSIKYPTVFKGEERKVYVTGEAYFEVTHNKKKPFRVNINSIAEVGVLGTRFNVSAYTNEKSIQATLLEGAISFAMSSERQAQPSAVRPAILQPGQQAVVMFDDRTKSGVSVVNDADIDKVMAWKLGLFNFDGLTFEEIMRQIERWYNIDVLYENNAVPNKRLAGEMSRDVPLSGLLKNLEKLGLRYTIDGRVLTLLP